MLTGKKPRKTALTPSGKPDARCYVFIVWLVIVIGALTTATGLAVGMIATNDNDPSTHCARVTAGRAFEKFSSVPCGCSCCEADGVCFSRHAVPSCNGTILVQEDCFIHSRPVIVASWVTFAAGLGISLAVLLVWLRCLAKGTPDWGRDDDEECVIPRARLSHS